jgi:hypothetical protein
MICKQIQMHGMQVTLVCDGRCDKAFGIADRPTRELGYDEDDFVYLTDDELGTAPAPDAIESREGGNTKPSAEPIQDGERMNRWCARQCERCGRLKGHAPDRSRHTPNMGAASEVVAIFKVDGKLAGLRSSDFPKRFEQGGKLVWLEDDWLAVYHCKLTNSVRYVPDRKDFEPIMVHLVPLPKHLNEASDLVGAMYAVEAGGMDMLEIYAAERIGSMCEDDRRKLIAYMEALHSVPPYTEEDVERFLDSDVYALLTGKDGEDADR